MRSLTWGLHDDAKYRGRLRTKFRVVLATPASLPGALAAGAAQLAALTGRPLEMAAIQVLDFQGFPRIS